VEAVLAALERLDIREGAAGAHDEEDFAALTEDRTQFDELASLYAERTITAQEWIRARTQIERRIEECNSRIASAQWTSA
jgi:hypothetical protein